MAYKPKTTDPNAIVLANPETGDEQIFGSDPNLNKAAIQGLQSKGYKSYVGGVEQQINLGGGTPPAKLPRYGGQLPEGSPQDTAAGAATGYFADQPMKAPTPDEEEQIRESIRKRLQVQVDAVNQIYEGLLGKEEEAATGRLGEARAIAARSGTLGQDFGIAQKEKVEDYNKKIRAGLEGERALKIAAIFDRMDTRASEEIAAKTAEAKGNAKAYIDYLDKTRQAATEDIKALAQSGVRLDQLSDAVYKRLLKQSGKDEFTFEALFNASKKKEEKIDYTYRVEGGKLFAFGVDPTTGQLKTMEKDLGIVVPKNTEIKEVEGELWMVDKEKGTATKLGGPGKKPDMDPAVLKDLQDAQAAINSGADQDLVRKRFLETHPKQASFYDQYFKVTY